MALYIRLVPDVVPILQSVNVSGVADVSEVSRTV
jgi:hypothetical protein